MQIITHVDAVRLGLTRYYTGKPCRHGHIAERYTCDKVCAECKAIRTKKYTKESGYYATYYQKSKDQILDQQRKYRENHRNARSVVFRQWRQRNIEHERERSRQWIKNNKELKALNCAKRRASHKQATPIWADHSWIKEYYKLARWVGLQVDHIVPLNHPVVCGLHCEANLQLLPVGENQAKGNRWWPGK